MINKILSLFLSALLLTVSAAPVKARGGLARTVKQSNNVIKGLRTQSFKALSRRSGSCVLRPSVGISVSVAQVPASILKANKITLPRAAGPSVPGASKFTAQVSARISAHTEQVDVTSLEFSNQTASYFVDYILKTGNINELLNVLPHLWVERAFPRTPEQNTRALAEYRKILATEIPPSASKTRQISLWSSQMAAVSNLGFFGGGAEDVTLLLQVYEKTPPALKPHTEIIIGRTLLMWGEPQALTQLAAQSMKNGKLAGEFWAGVKEYARETGLALELPEVVAGSKIRPLSAPAQDSLKRFNALNALHLNPGLEATKDWLLLHEHQGVIQAQNPAIETGVLPDKTGPPAPAQNTSAPTAPGQTAAVEQSAAQHALDDFRHHFFEDATGRPGPLGLFCQAQHINYTGKTLEDVLTLISSTPDLRSSFISMVKTNRLDIVDKLIKGLGKADYQTLKQVYPAKSDADEFSPRLGEDILNLLHAATDSPQAQQIGNLLNKGYIFISHFRGKRIYLGTEFNVSDLPFLIQHIQDFNRAHGIGRAEFMKTFSPSAGKTAAVTTNPLERIEPDRVFIFNDGREVSFAELPAFLQQNPYAKLRNSYYRKIKSVTYTNPKTKETVTKPGVVKLHQEALDEELRPLDNLLRGADTRAVLLLDGPTAEENFRFMFNRMQDIKPVLTAHLRQLLGEKAFTLSYRFGEHEIEGRGNVIPMANMHMHLEAYIPALNFTYNLSIPLRVSEKAKADILAKFQEWEAKGKPQGSPIEYYGQPSFWEQLIPNDIRLIPGRTAPAEPKPAAEYPEMYEGNFSPGFAF